MKKVMEFAQENGKKLLVVGGVVIGVIALIAYAVAKSGNEGCSEEANDVDVEVEFEAE